MNSTCKLPEESYKKILQEDLQNDNFEILEINEKSISNIAIGIMGGHYKVEIKVKINNEVVFKRYFTKTMKSIYDVQNEMIKIQGAYEKEAFAYEIFFKELSKIPGYNIDYIPKCYLTVKDEMFILEDVQESGYSSTKSGYLLDNHHLKTAFDMVAKFHAASIIYEEHQSKLRNNKYRLIDEYPEYFQEPLYRREKEYLGNKLLKTGSKAVLAIIDIAPQFAANKNKLKAKLLKHAENTYDLVKPSKKYRNVICHGDLWSCNILFKYNGDTPIAAKLIDFQALRYTVPAHDVMCLLLSSNRMAYIKKYEKEILLHYYESLRKYLHEYKIDINKLISYDEFLETIDYILPFVIVQIVTWTTMYLFVTHQDELEDPEFFKNFMYEDRTELCVEEYAKNPNFREVMDDAFLYLNLLK